LRFSILRWLTSWARSADAFYVKKVTNRPCRKKPSAAAKVGVKNGEIRIASDHSIRKATDWVFENYGWVLKRLA
jgi:hypothetical protein